MGGVRVQLLLCRTLKTREDGGYPVRSMTPSILFSSFEQGKMTGSKKKKLGSLSTSFFTRRPLYLPPTVLGNTIHALCGVVVIYDKRTS